MSTSTPCVYTYQPQRSPIRSSDHVHTGEQIMLKNVLTQGRRAWMIDFQGVRHRVLHCWLNCHSRSPPGVYSACWIYSSSLHRYVVLFGILGYCPVEFLRFSNPLHDWELLSYNKGLPRSRTSMEQLIRAQTSLKWATRMSKINWNIGELVPESGNIEKKWRCPEMFLFGSIVYSKASGTQRRKNRSLV